MVGIILGLLFGLGAIYMAYRQYQQTPYFYRDAWFWILVVIAVMNLYPLIGFFF